jgi:hypothetical protein
MSVMAKGQADVVKRRCGPCLVVHTDVVRAGRMFTTPSPGIHAAPDDFAQANGAGIQGEMTVRAPRIGERGRRKKF